MEVDVLTVDGFEVRRDCHYQSIQSIVLVDGKWNERTENGIESTFSYQLTDIPSRGTSIYI